MIRTFRFYLIAVTALVACLWIGPGVAHAVPAAPGIVTFTQPDGTSFEAQGWGDEYSHGLETPDGFTVLQDEQSGFWFYATVDPQTQQLVATDSVVGRTPPPATALNARPALSAEMQAMLAQQRPLAGPIGVASAPVLVILANYTDRASVGSTEADWVSAVFGATNSARHFYREVSYSKFDLTKAAETCGTANNGVTNWLNIGAKHPNPKEQDLTGGPAIATAALQAADGCVNYASFDRNKDKIITPDELIVIVILAGYEQALSGNLNPSIWGHANTTTTPALDGITSFPYGLFGEWHATTKDTTGYRATMGIIVHEMGHVLGWPDLYDTDYSSNGVGDWSVMGSGVWLGGGTARDGSVPPHPSAWEKWYQGWLSPMTLTSTALNVSLPWVEANGANSVVVVPTNPNFVDWRFNDKSGTGEYFMIENRQQTGYDSELPGCGLLIWHIDEAVTSTNAANANEAHPLVDLLQADGKNDLDKKTNRGDDGDPYPGSSKNERFFAGSTPSSNFYALPSYISITDISPGCADIKYADMSNISTFVNRAASGAGADGTQARPYKTLATGVGNTANFGTVGLFPGTYNEPMTLSRPMTLRSTDGVVIIGRP